MHNALRVLRRDMLRLAKAPASWSVILFLVVLPSLYSWINVIGFWDPYNNTGNLSVCVVNEDRGVNDATLGELDIGDQIIDQLEENDKFDWNFTDRETAMDLLESGKVYAVYIVPSDFSSDIATIITSSFQQPTLEYYVNEKMSPVSPKITDIGASTLESTINDAFVSTVTATISQTLNDMLTESQGTFNSTKSKTISELDQVVADLDEAREAVAQLDQVANDGIARTEAAKESLDLARSEIAETSSAFSQLANIVATVNIELNKTYASFTTALDKSSILITSSAARANVSIGNTAADVVETSASVHEAAAYSRVVIQSNAALIDALRETQQSLPESETKTVMGNALDSLESANNDMSAEVEAIDKTATSIADTAEKIAAASDAINTSVQITIQAADKYRSVLSTQTIPQISAALADISTASSELSAIVARQSELVDQTEIVLDQLETTLSTTSDALDQTDAILNSVQGDIGDVRTDIAALGTSEALQQLFGNDGTLDVDKIADFMQSPTEVKTEELYPLNAYGSAMAPLFINLTLWIGVFMLMVILHTEVDDEEIEDLTLTQRYIGRGLLFTILVILQAIVCIAGCLYLGVQTINAPAFFITAIICSLTYLSLQYALTATLQHVGKGLCLILIFVQIPGATGLYPIELTTKFFQTVYPVFPFTYGINAMRETVCGFYGNAWLTDLGMLALFAIVFLLIGVFVRPFATNTNLMFAKQLSETDIVNHETVHLPEHRYRVSQIIRAMSNHAEFRMYLEEREARFLKLYPKLIRGAIAFGIGVPVIFTAAMAFLSPGQKVIVLTAWLVWLISVFMFLLVVEHFRDSLERQAALDAMSDEELRDLFAARNRIDMRKESYSTTPASTEGSEN